MAAMNVGFSTPFQEQIDYLVKKLRLPTERWDDIQRSAHDRAFMVAGAAQADLLKDLHDAVVKAAAQGTGLAEFRKDFKAAVAKHGWTGWTGEGTKDGEAWRTKVIYQTNMVQSYWAGRYRQMSDPDVLKLRPYWRYIHSDGVAHPRPHHLAWHGLTLKADHPFWQTHFAPNGWGCRCRIEAVSKREGEASAAAGLDDLPADWDAIDPKTGTVVGIDKGFDYAPGAGVNASMRSLVEAKLIKLPHKLADALQKDFDCLEPLPKAPTVAVGKLAEMDIPVPVTTPQRMPKGLPEWQYLDAFQSAVGGYRLVEIAGALTRIDESLFADASGKLKLFKRERERYVEYLAATINAPDSIYEARETLRSDPSQERVVRRFLRAFGDGDDAVLSVVVFALKGDEFVGTTAFVPFNGRNEVDLAYFERQRVGRNLK